MQKTTRLQRLLAVIVAVFMAVCCLPLNAFAAGTVKPWFVFTCDGSEVGRSNNGIVETGRSYDCKELEGFFTASMKGNYTMPEGSITIPEDATNDTEIKIEVLRAMVTMNVRFMEGETFVAGGDYSLPAGVQNYTVLNQYVPEGYKLAQTGDFTVTNGGKVEVQVEKIATTGMMNVRFMEGETFVSGGDYILPLGVQNYSVLDQYVPEGYKLAQSGDFTVTDGGKIEVQIEKIATTGIMNVRFMEGETFVSGGDYTLPLGVQNYSVLNQYVPEGYKLAQSGDFTVTDGGKIEVQIEKIAATGIMNVRFMEGETFVSGGDYTLPLGVQNYSVLNQYVPEGYKMSVSGDFTVVDGGKVEVPVEKISNTVIMNIRFMDGETFVAGGDYTLTAGVQNYSALQSYVPEGYVLEVSGDFMAAEGAKLDVPVKKITNEVIMNILFKDGDEVVAGGDYFVPAGVQNYNVLGKYVPAGYSMDVSGDFMAAEGAKLEVPVSKIENAVIMNIRFIDSTTGEFVAGGDYFLPEGVQNYKVLTQYVPEGYKMDVSGDFTVAEGTSLDVPVSKLPAQIIMNIRFMEGETFIAGGDYFVTEGVNNYSVLADLGYLPEGYEMDVAGDFMAKEGAKLDVPVHKIKDGGEDSSSSSDNTTTVSSNDNKSNNNQVVKAETPADNTAKVMPQTGLTAETPVVFGVMMVAALAGAGAYLFAIRKKLN